ncbi:MAG TPA: hypothetical protein VL860_07150 [Planctomycetota bacterium]|nr:hypothetical protein [Planctomycetota bacterium]
MAASSVVIVFDQTVAQGADGLPDLGLALLDWVRIGSLVAVRISGADFDATLRLFGGYVSDSEQPEGSRQMPAGMGPWQWECYDQAFAFAAGDGWPPVDVGGLPGE